MQAVHALSASYGHLAQGITGIFWFYRQFGYEYALDLGGGRSIPLTAIPERLPDEPEPYILVPAQSSDVRQIMRLYDRQRAGRLVSTPRDDRSETTSQKVLHAGRRATRVRPCPGLWTRFRGEADPLAHGIDRKPLAPV